MNILLVCSNNYLEDKLLCFNIIKHKSIPIQGITKLLGEITKKETSIILLQIQKAKLFNTGVSKYS